MRLIKKFRAFLAKKYGIGWYEYYPFPIRARTGKADSPFIFGPYVSKQSEVTPPYLTQHLSVKYKFHFGKPKGLTAESVVLIWGNGGLR